VLKIAQSRANQQLFYADIAVAFLTFFDHKALW